MTTALSTCCKFDVGQIDDADAYCYVCGKVHQHGHLDLRHLRATLLGKVVRRHNLNWQEIQKDQKKFGGMQKGVFCQSILTEIEALCPHGNPLSVEGKTLRLHMCYGQRPDEDEIGPDSLPAEADLSVAQGLDFTSDLCNEADSAGVMAGSDQFGIAEKAEECAGHFKVGDVLRYDPKRVAFELA